MAGSCLLLIYSSLYIARPVTNWLRDANLLRLAVAGAFFLAAAWVGLGLLRSRPGWRVWVALAGIVAGYVVLLPLVGYRVATLIFMVALQAVFVRPDSARRWTVVFVSALATTVITYLVFEHYLSVLLPRGHWTDW